MQIPNIFKKKEEDKYAQAQNKKEATKERAGHPLRDEKGRFIGKKKEEVAGKTEDRETPKTKRPQIISVTFFGKEVRKIYFEGKWYFNINDVYNLSTPKAEGREVKVSEEYEKIKKEVSHEFKDEEYATAEDIKKLVEQINGIFPGPFTRWLDESANMEYVPIPES